MPALARIVVDPAVRSRDGKCAIRPWIGHAAAIAQRADGVALDLFCHLEQHVDLALWARPSAMRVSTRHIQPVPSRQRRYTGRPALMLVEIGNARGSPRSNRSTCHHDDGGGAETGAQFAEAVEIHRRVDDRSAGHHAHRRAAGDHGLKMSSAADAAGNASRSTRGTESPRLFDVARAFGHGREMQNSLVPTLSAGRCRRTMPRRAAGWSAPPRSTRHC